MYGQRNGMNRGGGRFDSPTPPVKVGDELDVTIEAVGEKGDGIAKKNGFVIFVPNTKEGQTVRIRLTKVLRKVGFGEVIGEASGAPEESAPAEESADGESSEESEDVQDDSESEDFGEEPAEESAETEEQSE